MRYQIFILQHFYTHFNVSKYSIHKHHTSCDLDDRSITFFRVRGHYYFFSSSSTMECSRWHCDVRLKPLTPLTDSNPTARIHFSHVPFLQTLTQNSSIFSFMLWHRCAYDLDGLRHKKHLVRVQDHVLSENICFGHQKLSPRCHEFLSKILCFVATNMAGMCPKISSYITLTNLETQSQTAVTQKCFRAFDADKCESFSGLQES